MTKKQSIYDIGNLYNQILSNNIIEEKTKMPKCAFPEAGETVSTTKDFDESGPNKALGKKVKKKNLKKRRKTISEDLNSFMKSKFDQLFENVMEDENDMDLGPTSGPEGDDLSDLDDMGSDLGSDDAGADDVTLTIDKETAQKLIDLLQAAVGGEEIGSEEDDDLEDLEIDDEDSDEDYGMEDEEEDFQKEETGTEKLPDTAGHKLTKGMEAAGNVKASKGKASSEVTDETGTTVHGHPFDHKSNLTKPGNNKVGNLKAGQSYIK